MSNQYAYFNSTLPQPTPILGWMDFNQMQYQAPPPANDLLAVTPAQWAMKSQITMINNGQLVMPTPESAASALATAISAKDSELAAACSAAIVAGFYSSALGVAYFYPSDPTSQFNLSGSVLDSLLSHRPTWTTQFWCMDTTGFWSFIPHTATQIQRVGSDGKAWIVLNQRKLFTLRQQLSGATTIAAVTGLIWS